MTQQASELFKRNGYCEVDAVSKECIDNIRNMVFEAVDIELDGEDLDRFLNNFHNIEFDENFNDVRMRIIGRLRHDDIMEEIYRCFKSPIRDIIGPDLLAQKSVNLVIHRPGGIDNSPVHRDSPPNSPFEIVVWIPLVNCYKTKSLAILNVEKSLEFTKSRKDRNPSMTDEEFLRDYLIDVDYGKAVIFWSGLFHGVPVNKENETRWSLNVRFKSAFTPNTGKGVIDYYKIFRVSPLAKFAIDSVQ